MKLSQLLLLDELTAAFGAPDEHRLFRDPASGEKFVVSLVERTWSALSPNGEPMAWQPLEPDAER